MVACDPARTPKRPWRKRSSIACELAALIPRPDANLFLYHGVLARWRSLVVRCGRPAATTAWDGVVAFVHSPMVTPSVRLLRPRADG
jgi:hypothetical protein